MKKSLYDTIGVNKGASQEEIKKAFREKAKETHPDTENGNTMAMVELNKAYKVLSDADKRKRYDETGQDSPEQSFEVRFKSLIKEVFILVIDDTKSIDNVDIIKSFNSQLNAILDGFKSQHKDHLFKKEKYEKVKLRLKSKDDNSINEVIDTQIEMCNNNLGMLNTNIDFIRKSKEVLKKYYYDFDKIQTSNIVESFTINLGSNIGPNNFKER